MQPNRQSYTATYLANTKRKVEWSAKEIRPSALPPWSAIQYGVKVAQQPVCVKYPPFIVWRRCPSQLLLGWCPSATVCTVSCLRLRVRCLTCSLTVTTTVSIASTDIGRYWYSWVVSIHTWRRTFWVVGVLGEGTEGLSRRRLGGQSRQQLASSGSTCLRLTTLLTQVRLRHANHGAKFWQRPGDCWDTSHWAGWRVRNRGRYKLIQWSFFRSGFIGSIDV